MEALHHRLRVARERAGLMQFQLAEKLHVRPSAVSHWETGRRVPRMELLAKIAKLTMTDVNQLLNVSRRSSKLAPQIKEIRVPTQKANLQPAERELILFWRHLSVRQQQNFLKLIKISFAVRSKIEYERQLDKSRATH